MRTTIKAIDRHHVIMTLPDGETREFWCPFSGGYVRQIDAAHPGTLGWQVCERLESAGSTLYCDPERRPLVDIIRKEMRRARRSH